jgi:hypothetical protein
MRLPMEIAQPKEPRPVLPYQPYQSRQPSRICQWLGRRSYWSIALALILPVIAVNGFHLLRAFERAVPRGLIDWTEGYLLFAAICLPGAVRKLSWRRGLAMLAIAGGIYEVQSKVWWGGFIEYPLELLLWFVPTIGFCHWLAEPTRRVRVLLWTLGLTTAIAFVVPTISQPLSYTDVLLWRHGIALAFVLHWILIAGLIWFAIAVAERLALPKHIVLKLIAIATAIASIVCFAVYFGKVEYRLALWSLRYGYPYTRLNAVSIVKTEWSPDSEAELWDVVESGNWSPRTTNNDICLGACVELLCRQNRSVAANRLALLLQRKPSAALADSAAPYLAAERHYEVAPELMRFALIGSETEQSRKALIAMRIPQEAFLILRYQSLNQLSAAGHTGRVDAKAESQLAGIFGKDIGPKLIDWTHLYDTSINTVPTPLTKAEADDVNRVISAMVVYWKVLDRVTETARSLDVPLPNLEVAGTDAFVREIKNYRAAATRPSR